MDLNFRWEKSSDNFQYIDVFENGRRKTVSEIKASSEHDPSKFEPAKPLAIFQRMVRNLVTSAQIQDHEFMGPQITWNSLLRTTLELTQVIGEDFEYPGFALCQIYLQLTINHREIIRELDNYENWPLNMVGGNEHLRNSIRGLRRLCMVSKFTVGAN